MANEDIVESPDTEQVATDFEFTEGPVWHPDGYLMFTEISRAHQIWKLVPGEEPELMRDDTGRATGLTLDLTGHLIACEQETRQVTRTWPGSHDVKAIATHWQGKRLDRPNDVVGRSDGSLYFTSRGAQGVDPSGLDLEHNGVYRIAPDGEVHQVVYPFVDPNGLAFSPDEDILYLANTRPTMHLDAFDVQPDGSLANQRRFFDFPGEPGDIGVPDGVKVDQKGRVFCTGPDGIWVIDPDGTAVSILQFPEVAVNMGWGDEDNKTLYVGAKTSIYTIRLKTPGTRIPRSS